MFKYLTSKVFITRRFATYAAIRYGMLRSVGHRESEALISPRTRSEYSTHLFKLSQLVKEKSLDMRYLLKEEVFNEICNDLVNDVENMELFHVCNVLKSLLTMGMPAESKVVQHLENELLLRHNTVQVNSLIYTLVFHVRFQETELQKTVVAALLEAVEKRMHEIWKLDDLVRIYSLHEFIAPEVLKNVETKILTFLTSQAAGVSAFDLLCNLIVFISQTKKRPKPLLQSAAEIMVDFGDKNRKYDPQLLINTVCALKTLNFRDFDLLEKLCDLLIFSEFSKKVKPKSITALLAALGQFNHKNSLIMDAIIDECVNTVGAPNPHIVVSLTCILGRCNYNPDSLKNLLSEKFLTNIDPTDFPVTVWLDFVWSLTILQRLHLPLIGGVLNESFCRRVSENADFELPFLKMKLSNIKASAELEMGINRPNLEPLLDFEKPMVSLDSKRFCEKVVHTINYFLPKDKYLLLDVKTSIGTFIDIQFETDPNLRGKVLTLPEPVAVTSAKEKLPMPSDLLQKFKKIAMMTVTYKDILDGGSAEVVGRYVLLSGLLEKQGYVVVVINEKEFPFQSTVVSRVKFVQRKIKAAFES